MPYNGLVDRNDVGAWVLLTAARCRIHRDGAVKWSRAETHASNAVVRYAV